jgi:RNA 3'-terminal phosphate cyclase (ATP)
MIRIDGSIGEGGGQTVRTALALAAVTRREVEISEIRKGRRLPGIRGDLLAVAKAVASVSNGRVEGASIGSDTLRFYPGTVRPRTFEFTLGDPTEGTAPTTLLLQTIAPALALAGGPSELVLRGSTHGPFSPTATYVQTVFVPTVRKFGMRVEVATPRWGWAPTGAGELRAKVTPVDIFHAADLTQRGVMLQIGGSSVASVLDEGFAERQRDRVNRRMQEVGRQALVQVVNVPCDSPGGMVYLLAVFERAIAGFTGVATPGGRAEEAADAAVNELFAYLTSYSVLDKHLTDQLLIYAALAEGVTSFSTAELTLHATSTASIIEQFLPTRISFVGEIGKPAEVEVYGAGGIA